MDSRDNEINEAVEVEECSSNQNTSDSNNDENFKPLKSTAKKPTSKKSNKKTKSNELFAELPKSVGSLDVIDLGIGDEEAKRIEEEAIAALPHAESIDTLLFDTEEENNSHETPEETEKYESFLADYKQTMAAIFEEVKRIENNSDDYDEDDDKPLLVKQKEMNLPAVEEESASKDSDSENQDEGDNNPFIAIASNDYSISSDSDLENEELDTKDAEAEDNEDTLVQMAIDFGEIASQLIEEAVVPDSVTSDEATSKNRYNPEKPRLVDSIFDFVELFVFTLLAVFILTSFFFRHSVVSGGSMENTLQDGEHLIISHLFYTPKRGDIVVFEDREAGVTSPYVKRVIGIEGDEVRVDPDGSVYVNGDLIEEKYVFTDGPDNKKTGTFPVGEGEVFVMGDHRNVSEDSRKFGAIDVDSIYGKVILRFYPFSEFGTVK